MRTTLFTASERDIVHEKVLRQRLMLGHVAEAVAVEIAKRWAIAIDRRAEREPSALDKARKKLRALDYRSTLDRYYELFVQERLRNRSDLVIYCMNTLC